MKKKYISNMIDRFRLPSLVGENCEISRYISRYMVEYSVIFLVIFWCICQHFLDSIDKSFA